MDPIGVIATVGVLAIVLKGIIQAIRRQWSQIDGLWVQMIAIALGFGAAAAFDIRATAALLETAGAQVGRMPVPVVDWLITGVAIAFSAGLFAEAVSTSGNRGLVTVINQTPTD